MGAIANDISSAKPRGQGMPCGVARILRAMTDPDDVAQISEQMELGAGDPRRLSAADLADLLGRHGLEVSPQTIERHRRQVCRCFIGTAK